MATLGQFAKRIRRRGRNVERNVEVLVRKVALLADQTLVLATPVDTGRARSNWVVSLGSGTRENIEPYSPGEGLGAGESANASAAIAQGQSVIKSYKLRDGSIFISNNVPYIGQLNAGTSAQAPAGFIEQAVLAAASAVNATVRISG